MSELHAENLFRFPVAGETLIKWMDNSGIYLLKEDGTSNPPLPQEIRKNQYVQYYCRRPEWATTIYLQKKPTRKDVWNAALMNSKQLQNANWRLSEGNKIVSNIVDTESSYLGLFTGELIPYYSREFYRYVSVVTWEEAKNELFEASLHYFLGYFAANGEAMGYVHQLFDRNVWNFIQRY